MFPLSGPLQKVGDPQSEMLAHEPAPRVPYFLKNLWGCRVLCLKTGQDAPEFQLKAEVIFRFASLVAET